LNYAVDPRSPELEIAPLEPEEDESLHLVQRRWYRGAFSTPKGGKARRVDMSRQLRKVLLELRDQRLLQAYQQGRTSIADDLVFPGNREAEPSELGFYKTPAPASSWSRGEMFVSSTGLIRQQVRNHPQPSTKTPVQDASGSRPQVIDSKGWCERGESNPHPLRDQILSLARLPVPPLSPSS
jgi:hypothetical protein